MVEEEFAGYHDCYGASVVPDQSVFDILAF